MLTIQDRLQQAKANKQIVIESRAQEKSISRTETVSAKILEGKTLSAAIALVVLKYGYPLSEWELMHGGRLGS